MSLRGSETTEAISQASKIMRLPRLRAETLHFGVQARSLRSLAMTKQGPRHCLQTGRVRAPPSRAVIMTLGSALGLWRRTVGGGSESGQSHES
jgi:hypothetical protein